MHCFHWRFEQRVEPGSMHHVSAWERCHSHTGTVLLQPTASLLAGYRSQAPCTFAQCQYGLRLQLLLALKQMWNSGRSINPQFLPWVTGGLCHCVRPAQQMEHQPVPRKEKKTKVPVPTPVCVLVPALNTGNTCWSLKFTS